MVQDNRGIEIISIGRRLHRYGGVFLQHAEGGSPLLLGLVRLRRGLRARMGRRLRRGVRGALDGGHAVERVFLGGGLGARGLGCRDGGRVVDGAGFISSRHEALWAPPSCFTLAAPHGDVIRGTRCLVLQQRPLFRPSPCVLLQNKPSALSNLTKISGEVPGHCVGYCINKCITLQQADQNIVLETNKTQSCVTVM